MTHELTPLTPTQVEILMRDLDQSRVATRGQGGTTLSYLEAHDVKATLIRVFGFGGFSAEVIDTRVLRMDHDIPAWEYQKDRNAPKKQKMEGGQPVFNWRVTAMATVKLTIHQLGAVYTESAASSQTGPDVGEVADFAIKTAESDALKRAAIYLGTQFGLSLYAKGATQDQVVVIFEPQQAAALATERNRIWEDWNRAQQAGNAASAPQAPAGAPNGVQQGQVPIHADPAVQQAQGAAMAQLQAGVNVAGGQQ